MSRDGLAREHAARHTLRSHVAAHPLLRRGDALAVPG